MAVIKLQPKPYIIESLIQSDDWDWPKALSEFIDNSFGKDAGNATAVRIEIEKDLIRIIDNGTGVDDLQRCFALGDSKSRYSKDDIGRYGVGAKHASVWMGKVYQVHTCTDGRYVRSATANWDRVRRESDWGEIQDRQITANGSPTGTKTIIKHFWPGRKRIIVGSIARQLSETFAPALADGRTIRITDFRRNADGEHVDLVPWSPKGWSDRVSFSGAIEGRAFNAEVGVLSDAYSSDTGLRLCFAHRVICRLTKLAGKTLPVRMFGYVRLGSQWKDRLATNKTQIVDSHDLEEALLEHPAIVRLMQMAEDYQYQMLIENIMPRLEVNLAKALRLAEGGETFARRREPVNEGTNTRKHPQPPAEESTEGRPATKEDAQSRGITIKVGSEGRHIVGRVEDNHDGLCVLINKDCPACKDALDEAINGPKGYYPALFALIGSIFAIKIAEIPTEAERWLKRTFQLTRTERNMTMIEAFMNWWMFSVAGSLKNEEKQ